MYSLKLLRILVSICQLLHSIQLQLDDSFAYQEYVMYSLKLLRILVSISATAHIQLQLAQSLLPIKSNVFSEATSNISKYMSATAQHTATAR